MAHLEGATENGAGIRGLTITKRGQILLELASEKGVEWLQVPENETAFVDKFCPGSKIIRRNYSIIAQFTPITWDPSDPESLRRLESDLNLKTGDIVAASWVKNPARRGPGQKVAHVKINSHSPHVANTILISDVRIAGRYVKTKKDVPEPNVCSKCQQYGHFIAKCPSDHDTCGRCAGEHRTANCPDKANTKCTPCGSTDHYTNHQDCPEYQKRVHAQEMRNPELAKPFFPTEERWTWDDSVETPWIASSASLDIPSQASQ
ncbi:hypothetical protein M408DRAFT_71551, partial [Serendipita vermifera MAFF 305830]